MDFWSYHPALGLI